MDKKIALKWAKALESGEYKQAKHSLSSRPSPKKAYGYCCLGVLCDIYRKETGDGAWDVGEDGRFFSAFSGDDDAALPPAVQEWAGMRTDFGQYGNPSTVNLSNDNDDGHDFKTIAKTIRKHYKDL